MTRFPPPSHATIAIRSRIVTRVSKVLLTLQPPNIIFHVAVIFFLLICDCNIHLFQKLGKGMFQDEMRQLLVGMSSHSPVS